MHGRSFNGHFPKERSNANSDLTGCKAEAMRITSPRLMLVSKSQIVSSVTAIQPSFRYLQSRPRMVQMSKQQNPPCVRMLVATRGHMEQQHPMPVSGAHVRCRAVSEKRRVVSSRDTW